MITKEFFLILTVSLHCLVCSITVRKLLCLSCDHGTISLKDELASL